MYKERQFIFTSSWKFAKFFEKALQEVGKEKDLTQSEMDVLLFLCSKTALNTSRDIAEHRSISKSLICKSVSSLSKKGLLVSSYDEIDARVLRLELTNEGQNLAYEVIRCCDDLAKSLFAGVPDSEVQFLSNTLRRLEENGRRRYS